MRFLLRLISTSGLLLLVLAILGVAGMASESLPPTGQVDPLFGPLRTGESPGQTGRDTEDPGFEPDTPSEVADFSEYDGCGPAESLDSLTSTYSPETLRETVIEIARRRYPQGERFIDALPDQALSMWVYDQTSIDAVLESFPLLVHEGSHLWIQRNRNHRSGSIGGYNYPVDQALEIETPHRETAPRNIIVPHHTDIDSDSYAETYLLDDSGAQGFDTLLDEFNAYNHTLASYYCLGGLRAGRQVSARDGTLTLRYWVALYLQVTRAEDPETYAFIVGDDQTKRAILAVWDRSSELLAMATGPSLGLRDHEIRPWLTDELRGEIDRLR